MTRFTQLCADRRSAGKFICVGLDPDLTQIPASIPGTDARRVYQFLVAIIDRTHMVAMCFKPQSSYFEALGEEGAVTLRRVIEYVRLIDPTIPVILDYKRGDIGRTNEKYVELAFDFYGADAATIHPYLGMEAMRPFLDCADKTLFILCRTSNAGAGEFQDVLCRPLRDGATSKLYSSLKEARREGASAADSEFSYVMEAMPLYEFVARRVAQSWNAVNGNCAIVVGATYPDELRDIRNIVGTLPILIPGVGTQGGDLAAAVRNGFEGGALGIINNSSAILYAFLKLRKPDGSLKYAPADWELAAGEAARAMNDAVATLVATL